MCCAKFSAATWGISVVRIFKFCHAQELEESEDDHGNIILIERLNGGGIVHINGAERAARVNEIRANPSGSMDVRLHIDSQAAYAEDEEVGAIGV